MNPSLRTPSIQSIYTPPTYPINDVIFLDVEANGCGIIEREASITIHKPSENTFIPTASIPPSETPTLTPPPPPTNTATPTEIPMLLVESFENYTESILRESFPLNTNAGSEGSLRLVGTPHVQEDNGLVALAFRNED